MNIIQLPSRISLLLSILVCIIYFSDPLLAKTVQTGFVKEYNGKKDKTPLAGVSIQVKGASSTFSDQQGRFSLTFPKLKLGDKIENCQIEKAGFELFNTEELLKWYVNPKQPTDIIMWKSEELKKLKNTLRENSSDIYKRKFDATMKELAQLRAEQKIKEDEYISKLTDLSVNYANQLKNLDNYIDQFARIDLAEISDEEQHIVDLVTTGKLDEAISLYDQLNLVQKYKNNMADLIEIKKIDKIKKIKAEACDSLLKAIENNIKTLMLAGGINNTIKALDLYESVVQTETPQVNFDWLLKTGNFVFDYFVDLSKAQKYYTQALSVAEKEFGPTSYEVARCHINLGNVENAYRNYDEAISHFDKAYLIINELYGDQHPKMIPFYNNSGIAYFNKGVFSLAKSHYYKALDILKKEDNTDFNMLAAAYINLANCCAQDEEYDFSLSYCLKALDLIESYDKANVLYLASIYNNLGNAYFNCKDIAMGLHYLQLALAKFESVCGAYHPDVAEIYYNIGKLYDSQGKYEDAMIYYNKALNTEKILSSIQKSNWLPELYTRMGKIYEYLDQEENAISFYSSGTRMAEERADAGSSDFADAYRYLAEYRSLQNDWISSVDYLCKEVRIRKDLLKKSYSKEANKKKSDLRNFDIPINASLIDRSIYFDSDYSYQIPLAPLYLKIADIYYQHIKNENNTQEAQEYYKKALNIYESIDNSEDYSETIERIRSILHSIEMESK